MVENPALLKSLRIINTFIPVKKCHPLITVSSLIRPGAEQSNEHTFARHGNRFKKDYL